MPKPPKDSFTDGWIRQRKTPTGQVDYFETQKNSRSLVLTLNSSGRKSWSVMFYEKGKPKRRKLGYFGDHDAKYPSLTTKQAREAAAAFDVKAELIKGSAGSFKEVAENWFERHASKLRSKTELRRHLNKVIYPEWANVRFCDIRRGEVIALLDKIEDQRGANQADAVLATIRSIMNWQQSRDEHYPSPIVPKMRRDKRKPEEKERKRFLSADELRNVWNAADELGGSFGAIVKLCLLTGQRKAKIAQMRWGDVDFDAGVWTIATEKGEKGNPGKLPLPQIALNILAARPAIVGNPYVFAARAKDKSRGYFNSWSQRKKELDALLPPMEPWIVHDLRRTARTLMADIGIADHIAEKVLGHKLIGVMRVYERSEHTDKKGEALGLLASKIETILNPLEGNVVQIRA